MFVFVPVRVAREKRKKERENKCIAVIFRLVLFFKFISSRIERMKISSNVNEYPNAMCCVCVYNESTYKLPETLPSTYILNLSIQ